MIYNKQSKIQDQHGSQDQRLTVEEIICVQDFLGGQAFLAEPGEKEIFEPEHDKTNKMPFMPSKGSDQPVHPTSPINLYR